MRSRALFFFLLVAASVLTAVPALAQTTDTADPVVRTVLFFSPTCPHCEAVINEHLPGIFEQYGGKPDLFFDDTLPAEEVAFYEMTNGTLAILLVDVDTDAGAKLYLADFERIPTADEQRGVPRLTVEDRFYVGDLDIPAELPGIIEEGLAAGGIAWPAIPGIEDAIAAVPGMAEGNQPIAGQGTNDPSAELPAAGDESVGDRLSRDPLGNGLAIVVLLAMVISLVAVPVMIRQGRLGPGPSWVVPVLSVVGIGVSIYLGIVETQGVEAVCGPVGDCNTVQQSQYATIFGIHIGILGIIGYALLLGSWVVSRVAKHRVADLGAMVAAATAIGGTVFSIYLTFLEPFVIGATCVWCLTSAISITGLLWFTAAGGWAAYRRFVGSGEGPSLGENARVPAQRA
ncbi:MAG TPA: vitamin K epoxide reductase family protein [Acidimicrobiia bacterium]|nr:vitamin K epoxide reductase family protein [Acidimicrobiia bacterium]